jgi:hypothetical protein
VRLLDLAASVALEVAREQWLQLDDERELRPSAQLLLGQVAADSNALAHWYGH